ncbi:helix-turn-helix transcriptional regulator [Streptomyces zaomyceticus]|uniref:helix-turn-helix transcriptional regulator n=1 Tax=Streptomyces zaomyceticus TaxID=68286 RepID=UPI0036750388
MGREAELSVLRKAVTQLRVGIGGVVLVEGEPGIGKSSLIVTAATDAEGAGCTVLRGTADQVVHPLPLRLLFDCLEITQNASDSGRAEIARFARPRRPDVILSNVAHTAVAEMLITLVEELCADSPTLMVLDDVQWADEASLEVCRHLASIAEHLPLLLIMSFRAVPQSPGMRQLRAALSGRPTITITLGPLGPDSINSLVSDIAGAQPGTVLLELAAQASGNPLYVRELVESLMRDGSLAVGERAELRETTVGSAPSSLAAALDNRLSFVGTRALNMLRMAALLGREFSVTELAALLDRSVIDMSEDLLEAVAAGVLIDVGRRMEFRHALIRQALYDGMPSPLRLALHRDAAQALDRLGGVELQRVAQQLLAAGPAGDRWTRSWLVENAPVLAIRAPHIAAELLQRELGNGISDERDRAALSMAHAHILVGTGEHEVAAVRARQALVVLREPSDRGQMYWVLARAQFSGGHNDAAVTTLEKALARTDLPDGWRARLLASLAMVQRAGSGELDVAAITASRALEIGERARDTFAVAYALTCLWLNHSVQRRHLSALECTDQALETLSAADGDADLRAYVLHSRIFTLQNLSRWSEAELALQEARRFLLDADRSDDVSSSVTAAVLTYWLGRWDDTLAELAAVDQSLSAITYRGLRERGPMWLHHGVAALIAVHQDDRATAGEHIRAGLRQPPATVADRENTDFLVVAQALAAEQAGDLQQALSHLHGFLQRQPGAMTLIHQWLPTYVRLALAVDDRKAAEAALHACRAEAAMEQIPARATAAADWCAGLYGGDPVRLRAAVEHYRAAGAPVELAGALEDLAVVVAGQGDMVGSKQVMGEALDLYSGFGAAWDIRRAEARLRRFGIRHGVRSTRTKRPTHGWEALTPTERKIALLVTAGRSTSEIAQSLFLTRRTTQTHISHILAKLGMRSRVEIAREAFRQDPEAVPIDV